MKYIFILLLNCLLFSFASSSIASPPPIYNTILIKHDYVGNLIEQNYISESMTTIFSEIIVGNQISDEKATLTYKRIFNPELSTRRAIDIPPPGAPRVGDKQNLIYKFELNGFIYEADVSMIYYKDPDTGATYWLVEKSSAKIIGKTDKFNDEK
ncbi:MAG: hypothetical protein P8N90_01755 [Glaciecola sp.]|nr:hypothetical protein [Glaciecola sp.]MDG1922565.1 hypothetical protein [Glaciecola sp.]